MVIFLLPPLSHCFLFVFIHPYMLFHLINLVISLYLINYWILVFFKVFHLNIYIELYIICRNFRWKHLNQVWISNFFIHHRIRISFIMKAYYLIKVILYMYWINYYSNYLYFIEQNSNILKQNLSILHLFPFHHHPIIIILTHHQPKP